MSWSYAGAVQAGVGKARTQDAFQVRLSPSYAIVAVCDGAGSAPHGEIGAKLASGTFCDRVGAMLTDEPLSAEQTARVLEAVRGEIVEQAQGQGRPMGQYATTLVGAVLHRDWSQFVQVGDGLAVVRDEGAFELALEPEVAEYINTTTFVTDAHAHQRVRSRVLRQPVREAALLTDGLQPLVTGSNCTPHGRFFATVFKNLRAECGIDQTASDWLGAMLRSELVTSRTDDDTCIVLLRRS